MDSDENRNVPDGDKDAEMIGAVTTVEDEYLNMIGMLGTETRAFKRDTRKAYNRIVFEIYSPPRVTRMASLLPSLKLLPGYAFDITQNDPEDGEPWGGVIMRRSGRKPDVYLQSSGLYSWSGLLCARPGAHGSD